MAESEGQQQQKYPYPWAVFFLFGQTFCERINYYGMRVILTIFLTRVVLYTQNTATGIFHAQSFLVYVFSILGAIISDSWLGKYKTIAYFSVFYVIGAVLLPIGAIEPLNLSVEATTLVSLLMTSICSGIIRPCVSAFGGDQFKLPEQKQQMGTFFLILYFSVNAGALITNVVTPILRQDVHCFDNEHCYALAFGVPSIFMVLSLTIFLAGRKLYKEKEVEMNTSVVVTKAVSYSIYSKITEYKTNPKQHILDYAEPKYGKQIVEDLKVLLRILTLFTPIPLFFALFDQMGSRWTFQATMMDGDMGSFEIKPDHMQLVNPLLIVCFIPIFKFLIYPAVAVIGINTPLRKMTIGGFLASAAFVVSAILEFILIPTYGVMPSEGMSQMRLFNGIFDCDYKITTNIPKAKTINLNALGYFELLDIDVSKKKSFTYSFTGSTNCTPLPSSTFDLENKQPISFFIYGDKCHPKIRRYRDHVVKHEQGFALMRVLANVRKQVPMYFKPDLNKQIDVKGSEITKLRNAEYLLKFDKTVVWTHFAKPGDIYTIIVVDKATTGPPQYEYASYRLVPENSVNILWQLPQYIVMALGEIMLSVTGWEFSYAQSPLSMKAALQACWLLNKALGNLIIIIVSTISVIKNQAYEYLLFAVCMFADMILFMFLAVRYKPHDPTKLAGGITD